MAGVDSLAATAARRARGAPCRPLQRVAAIAGQDGRPGTLEVPAALRQAVVSQAFRSPSAADGGGETATGNNVSLCSEVRAPQLGRLRSVLPKLGCPLSRVAAWRRLLLLSCLLARHCVWLGWCLFQHQIEVSPMALSLAFALLFTSLWRGVLRSLGCQRR